MSLTLAALRTLVDLGLTSEDILRVAEAQGEKQRSANAERQARFRARKAQDEGESVTCNVTSNGVTVTPEPSPPPFLSPEPPILPTPTPGSVTSRTRGEAGFERFWAAYPRKVGKGDARKAFDRAIRKIEGPDPPALLLAALERVKSTWTDSQFIPHPATWLNGERWNDEPLIQAVPNERHRPDQRQTAYLDRLTAVDSAMEAAVQQYAGGRRA